jgi:hypothetical protein
MIAVAYDGGFFSISQIPIAEFAAFSATHPPRVLSLAAFGRRQLVYVAPLSLAGIRNPTHKRSLASLLDRAFTPCDLELRGFSRGGARLSQCRKRL